MIRIESLKLLKYFKLIQNKIHIPAEIKINIEKNTFSHCRCCLTGKLIALISNDSKKTNDAASPTKETHGEFKCQFGGKIISL